MQRTTKVLKRAACALAVAGGLGLILPACTLDPANRRQENIASVLQLEKEGRITHEQAMGMLAIIEGQPPASSASAPATPTDTSSTPPSVPMAAVVPSTPSVAAPAGYTPESVITGRLRSVGSDTMDRLMALWEEQFRVFHPAVRFFHEGKGSSTAFPALMEGRSDFGPMSRSMKESEVTKFREKFGHEPIQLRVAVDAIGVYVHPSNPIAGLGMDFSQLDAVFSSTRGRGGADITTWGQLGLTGEWANAPIHVYSRNSASGTYAFFREHVLGKDGEYRSTNRELVGSAELVSAVAADPYGIGYSGIGYRNPSVDVVALSNDPGTEKIPPEEQYAYSGQYPLARFLYITVNHQPGRQPTPLQREFARFVYSPVGQGIVKDEGFFPVSQEIAEQDLALLFR
ncbi:MAG: PstS family phosphate ABC transporter substrate-binding protein [Lentisphaeria bacterium]|nr:PstS family phosphate ABC transporter substrate-binding protein [Lentisphaeria bacterium]